MQNNHACEILFKFIPIACIFFAGDARANSAREFCPARLSEESQDQIFSRVVNIGASFTHGCIECDVFDGFSQFQNLTQNSPWIRRNPILGFLTSTPWKNTRLDKDDFVAVYENDTDINLRPVLQKWGHASYKKYWGYFPALDNVALLSQATIDSLNLDLNFKKNVDLFQKDHEATSFQKTGVLYQWVNKSKNGLSAKPYVLMDLANDGGRFQDFLRITSHSEDFWHLYNTGWIDSQLRQKIIMQSVQRIKSLAPTSIIAFDAVFWDTITEALAYLYLQRPNSLVLKSIQSIVAKQKFGTDLDDPIKRKNIRNDFFTVLQLVSQDGPPVFLAKVLENPLKTLNQPEMRQSLAALISRAIQRMTGRDYTSQIEQAVRSAGEKENTGEFSFLAVNQIDARKLFAEDAMGGVGGGRLPFPLDSILNLSIQNALPDIPTFFVGLNKAFHMMNDSIENLKNSKFQHNIKIVNAEVFYSNFPRLLQPETLHPSVIGSRILANTVEWELCRD